MAYVANALEKVLVPPKSYNSITLNNGVLKALILGATNCHLLSLS